MRILKKIVIGLVIFLVVLGIAGFFIALGIFTRLFALLSAVEMAYAYFVIHAPQGFFPILNKGELALLFLVSFLIMLILGAGKYSLERYVLKRELF